MTPKINGIDHVHIYVDDRDKAEAWYQTVLGFKRVEALMVWAVENGPLTLENDKGNIHLALFQRDDYVSTSTIAFATDGEGMLAWITHLESHGLELRLADHKLAYSLYFSDPDGNSHEITTYDRDYVVQQLASI